MELWIGLSILYGILGGVTDIFKKKAVQKNQIIEVLAVYSFLSLLFILPSVQTLQIDHLSLLLVFLKSVVIFIGFFLSFKMIDKMPISVYSIVLLSKILFSCLWGSFFLGEQITSIQYIGIAIVIVGLILVNRKTEQKETSRTKWLYILLVVCAAALISLSVMLDKVITKTITPVQLQFWYTIFLTFLYWGYKWVRKIPFNYKKIVHNIWIPLLSITFFVADRVHFIASAIPESSVTVMTLLRQLSVLVAVVFGGIIFKEKHIIYKIFCSIIVLFGIFLIIFFT